MRGPLRFLAPTAQTAFDPPVEALCPLLDRRLLIVTGKGGTGKSTLCTALARSAAELGRRVVLVELGGEDHAAHPEHPTIESPGESSGEPSGNAAFRRVRLDPYDALAEYLALQVGFEGVVRRVLAHRGFRQLLVGAPGWKELISLGKIWHWVERGSPEERPDLVVVDAPATGHGLTFLDVPRVATRALRAGPLRRHAGWVEELLHDPERTLLLPITIPEELAVRESIELVTRLRERGLPIDRVILNAAEQYPCSPESLSEIEHGVAEHLEPAGGSREILIDALAALRVRRERTLRYREKLRNQLDLPLCEIPYHPGDDDALERAFRKACHRWHGGGPDGV